jgi:hypothetical protein
MARSMSYYCLAETTRVGRERVVQRRLLNLGELNTTQIDRWQRSIEVSRRTAEPASVGFSVIGKAGLRSRRRMFAKWCS